MKKGERLYIVNLESVSFFDLKTLGYIAQNDSEYYKTPFLFMVFSYVKCIVLDLANKNLTFIKEKSTGDWKIYVFEK